MLLPVVRPENHPQVWDREPDSSQCGSLALSWWAVGAGPSLMATKWGSLVGEIPQRPVGSSQAPKLQANDGPHGQQENTTHLYPWKGLAPPNQVPDDWAWAGPLPGSPALSLASTQRSAGRTIWGGEHPREEKGTDMTLSPSSPAPDGPPAWPLHSRKGLHTRRSSERRQVPWLPLDPPAWAFPAPAGVPGCSRPGAPFPTGGRPGARWLCYSFPPSSPLVPIPGTVPWFLGSYPLHSFCLCSGKKAPLFPSASDSRAPRRGTVAEPVFI